MQSISKQLKPALRWFTRSVIGFALACSAFWAGNGSAENVVVDSYPTWEEDWTAFYQQWQYWYVERELPREQAFRNALLASGFANTVTNFLGESSGTAFHQSIQNDVVGAIRVALGFPPNGFNGLVSSSPFMYPIPNCKTVGEWAEEVFGGHGVYSAPNVQTNMLAYLQYILNALSAPQDMAATTNLLTQQNTIISSNQTTIASVYEKLDELESTPTDEEIQESTDADTYTNAVPTAPLQLGSVDVDTSSMESVLDPITDGLDGLIPNESTTKPKIVMMQGNRSSETVEVELNLDGLEAVTRILRVLYKVGLWVGVIGILRSEWAFWSTLGGSAT